MPEARPAFKKASRIPSDFQSNHVNPGLRPLLLKTVDCLAIDRDGHPVLLPRRKRQRVQLQATMRYFYEVARLHSRWCFVEWNLDGSMVEIKITPTLKEAMAMYDRETETVTILDVP